MEIVIKYNNTHSDEHCPVCYQPFTPGVGPWFFVEGTWAPVCTDCAGKRLPAKIVTWVQSHFIIENMIYSGNAQPDSLIELSAIFPNNEMI